MIWWREHVSCSAVYTGIVSNRDLSLAILFGYVISSSIRSGVAFCKLSSSSSGDLSSSDHSFGYHSSRSHSSGYHSDLRSGNLSSSSSSDLSCSDPFSGSRSVLFCNAR
ncbi:hypothetical protein B0A55_12998 [Friedmanniomyces simplex]|uniref:Uncharacterized protein n=1 Tax=Friedmanniomyces simplex TaxID=329884 RepID=A0A4V5NFU5_9PEZI|nr:hypothetical protein B0A55_12998 [Friedmanniomyces simplex]